MRAAVMGAGSIGMFVGACIAKNGGQIDLIDADQANVEALNRHGATITGLAEFTAPVTACTPKEMSGVYDLFLLCTKQVVNREVVELLLPHLAPDGFLLTLQNGVPEPALEALAGKGRVAGGAVAFGATWLRPGVDELTSPMEKVRQFAFDIGEMDGSTSPRLLRAKQLLELCGGCTILPNLMGVRWAKLLMNATFSGMSAALGCTFGDVLGSEVAICCVVHLADEVIKVAHADGIRLEPLQHVDFEQLELLPGQNEADKYPLIHQVWDPHRALKASMLQDLEKGRKTEIDYINGHVCACGKKNGVATPFNDLVCGLVAEAEKQRRANRFDDTIQAFSSLL